MLYANEVHYTFSISTVKFAILLFYLRLFGSRQGFKKILYSTGALTISCCIGLIFPAIFRWTPICAAFSLDALYQDHHCINTDAYLVSTSVINVLLDVWILVLPLFIIWTLQLSPRQNYELSGVFLLGAL